VEAGKCVRWDTGTPDPDPGFIAVAKPQIWKNLGDRTLDPMGGITSKRLHLKKGPVAVAINEIAAFKTIIPAVMAQDIDWDDIIES
jgi:putative sterol carrier protein